MKGFRSTVLGYWKREGRHTLPWRKTHDPYKILISEMMLQQTQVPRVIPKYREFLKTFPTVSVLARAKLSDMLKVWSGLGYNRRAKYLHEAAKIIAKRGSFPQDYAGLRALPGIGDYTAKAVRVFAFNEPEVLIETNVRTVFLHHFFPYAKNVPDTQLVRYIALSIHAEDPRAFYSALMDYGSHLKQLYPNPSRRSKHHVKQSKFEGSLRQVRGAILRAAAKKTDLDVVKREYAKQFQRALDSLVRDGLITR
jgi:A/G-specific adenine glycosylase